MLCCCRNASTRCAAAAALCELRRSAQGRRMANEAGDAAGPERQVVLETAVAMKAMKATRLGGVQTRHAVARFLAAWSTRDDSLSRPPPRNPHGRCAPSHCGYALRTHRLIARRSPPAPPAARLPPPPPLLSLQRDIAAAPPVPGPLRAVGLCEQRRSGAAVGSDAPWMLWVPDGTGGEGGWGEERCDAIGAPLERKPADGLGRNNGSTPTAPRQVALQPAPDEEHTPNEQRPTATSRSLRGRVGAERA